MPIQLWALIYSLHVNILTNGLIWLNLSTLNYIFRTFAIKSFATAYVIAFLFRKVYIYLWSINEIETVIPCPFVRGASCIVCCHCWVQSFNWTTLNVDLFYSFLLFLNCNNLRYSKIEIELQKYFKDCSLKEFWLVVDLVSGQMNF